MFSTKPMTLTDQQYWFSHFTENNHNKYYHTGDAALDNALNKTIHEIAVTIYDSAGGMGRIWLQLPEWIRRLETMDPSANGVLFCSVQKAYKPHIHGVLYSALTAQELDHRLSSSFFGNGMDVSHVRGEGWYRYVLEQASEEEPIYIGGGDATTENQRRKTERTRKAQGVSWKKFFYYE